MSEWKRAYGVSFTDLERDRIVGDKIFAAVANKDLDKITAIINSLLPKTEPAPITEPKLTPLPKPVLEKKVSTVQKTLPFAHLGSQTLKTTPKPKPILANKATSDKKAMPFAHIGFEPSPKSTNKPSMRAFSHIDGGK